jgi:Zn-dependent peptidase ImmA (M78 family)/transcriptional regulator with XRE-family HTH domain
MKLGTIGFKGERLREAREARGLTAIALASLLGVTRAAVSQYEQDLQSPRPDVMERICQCLGLPAKFFLRDKGRHEGTIYWRSLASVTKLSRTAVERRLGWMQELVECLREFVDFPIPDFPELELPSDPLRITYEEIESIAMAVRRHWKLGDAPIQDGVMVLENNGVFISRDDLYVTALDALSRWSAEDGTPYCLIASGKCSAARSRMDLYHELGHLLLHRGIDQRYLLSPPVHKLIEEQAYRFAGAFALPEQSFAADIYSLSLDAFVNLKATWRVSVGMMLKRCENLGIIDEPTGKKLWIGMSARGWRTREPLDDEMPIEYPQLMALAIELLRKQGIEPRNYLTEAMGLPELDIEQLAGLPVGSLSGPGANIVTMDRSRRTSLSVVDTSRSSSLLEFKRPQKLN